MRAEDLLHPGNEENAREFTSPVPLYVMFAQEIYA